MCTAHQRAQAGVPVRLLHARMCLHANVYVRMLPMAIRVVVTLDAYELGGVVQSRYERKLPSSSGRIRC